MAKRVFEGLTVLISGATGGFGSAASKAFAEEGANLLLTDYHDEPLRAFSEEMSRAGVGVAALAGDIADEVTSRNLVDLGLKTFGGLDVAFNNAGIEHLPGWLPDLDEAAARKMMDVNVLGVFYAMKHQIPAMTKRHLETKRGCAILNTASAAGVIGSPTLSLYSAAKHAVVGLTRAAALENASRSVRVNALCPAFTKTPMVMDGSRYPGADMQAHLVRLAAPIPMKRIGEVSEIIPAVLWACSPENGFMTGQTIQLDGGLSV
jgi:NAD(P)-dependent dehydrogenase (short-subunit alcohol dehydrogenase family)